MTHVPMKSILLALCASAALAGCSANRSYGSWLDTFGMPPRSAPAVDAAQAAAWRAEIARLDAQSEALRVKLATEPDRVRRIAYLEELRALHDRAQPLRHALLFGPVPPASAPPVAAPDA